MKSYNEMAEDLMERKARYDDEKNKKRAALTRTVAPLCCVCLMAVAGFGLWQGGAFRAEPELPEETLADAVVPGVKDWYGPGEEEPPLVGVGDTVDEMRDTVVVNELDAISPLTGGLFDCHMDDFVEMSPAELNEYYGATIFGMAADGWDDNFSGGGIYRREGGAGELYWDFNTVTYTADGGAKSVFIMAAKGTKSYAVSLFEFLSDGELSEISGVSVAIGVTPDGQYQADFHLGESAIRVITSGLCESELKELLKEIVE